MQWVAAPFCPCVRSPWGGRILPRLWELLRAALALTGQGLSGGWFVVGFGLACAAADATSVDVGQFG